MHRLAYVLYYFFSIWQYVKLADILWYNADKLSQIDKKRDALQLIVPQRALDRYQSVCYFSSAL